MCYWARILQTRPGLHIWLLFERRASQKWLQTIVIDQYLLTICLDGRWTLDGPLLWEWC